MILHYSSGFPILFLLLMCAAQSWQCKVYLGYHGTVKAPDRNLTRFPARWEKWWMEDEDDLYWAFYSTQEKGSTIELNFRNVVNPDGYLRIYQNRKLNAKTWKLFNETNSNITSLNLTISNQAALKISSSNTVSYILTYKKYYCDVPDHVVADNCTNHWFRKSQCNFRCKDPTMTVLAGRKNETIRSICRKSHRWSKKLDKVCKSQSGSTTEEFDLERLQRIAEMSGDQGENFYLEMDDDDVTGRGPSSLPRTNCFLYCIRRKSTKDYYFPCSHKKLSPYQETSCIKCRARICRRNTAIFA